MNVWINKNKALLCYLCVVHLIQINAIADHSGY